MAEIHHIRDPFEIPSSIIPPGMVYQWVNLEDRAKFIAVGWAHVPFDRHGNIGFRNLVNEVEYRGLALMERSHVAYDAARQVEIDKAHKNDAYAIEKMKNIVRENYPDGDPDIMVNIHKSWGPSGL